MPVICAPVPVGLIPLFTDESVKSICGHDRISLSSTIAKCCDTLRICPRSASFFVTLWKALLPLPVNCISTTGDPSDGSKSWRVPDRFRSLPVMFGYGPFRSPG